MPSEPATVDVDQLRLPPGPVDLNAIDSGATPGYGKGGKKAKRAAKEALFALGSDLAELQEKLFAEGITGVGSGRSVLLVLQGMDTSGKGGVLKHTVGLVDPQGVDIHSFKAPSRQELKHDFLWRIKRQVPGRGVIGVFDRSHYEDVLIGRVRQLGDAEEIERRYTAINDFEAELAEAGTTVLKCMLHISPQTQRERLLARLDDPTKHWKFNPADLDERALWPAYREAYEIALERTNTELAPWYVVPSDHKWYRNLVIGHLLHQTLAGLNPQWPAADFDVDAERERLLHEDPLP